mmetsp:Transcript_8516/g.14350  ORF Transcript_8516/g.14350 Transcript_8516/m.14350 type:complete len:220 (+) Transcript_8516:223-882(+)
MESRGAAERMSSPDQDPSHTALLSNIPQILCILVFVVVVCICIFDFKTVQLYFNLMIQWIRINPYQAIIAIILLYIASAIFTLPTTFTHIMLGFTYSQVFQSQVKGFIFTVPIVLVGCLLGAALAFLLSRHLFKNFVKKQIENSGEWINRNFRAIDELLVAQGITIVALIRLTFAPFGITSYVLGVTSIPLVDFAIGTLAYIFNAAMQVFIGCSLFGMQ